MAKVCICGRGIPVTWPLCSGCLEIYGIIRAEWPEWLLFLVNDLNRENLVERRHRELAYNDEWNYANIKFTVEGQHYTRKDGWGPYSDS